MRIAEHHGVWRSIAIAAMGVGVGLAVSSLTCGVAAVRNSAGFVGMRAQAAPGHTAIHVKFREGRVRASAIDGIVPAPLFSSLHAAQRAVDDPRGLWMRVEVPERDVQRVLRELARDADVEEAFVPPAVSLPTTPRTDVQPADPSCPITTPSFESYQGYLAAAPHGIDAPAAWSLGALGQGVWFADVEGGWNAEHEDLPGDRMTHVGGQNMRDRFWQMHGTAVLGEVVGLPNSRGVVGIAPSVERVFTSSIAGVSVAEALDAAAEALRPGDVMLIELQGSGPRGVFLPVEYWDDNFDAIRAATARGVIVVEAAGNGAENLDHAEYDGKLQRKTRDSGAIMVGAGGPPRPGFADRERLDFSNYGSRVDVQGWGRMVATLDYGDLQACAGADRLYTGMFAGTSSASPIVAGAAILVQNVAKQRGHVLSPVEMRTLLRDTGTAQAGNKREQIGPRPDLARALARLASQ